MSRSLALTLAFAVGVSPALALAPRGDRVPLPPAPAARSAASLVSFRTEGARVASAVLHPDGAVRTVRGHLFPATEGDAESAARSFLAAHGSAFGVELAAEDLRLQQAHRSVLGTTVRFERSYQGLPLSPGVVVVHVAPGGEVTFATSDTGVVRLPDEVPPGLEAGAAVEAAVAAVAPTAPLAAPATARRVLRVLADGKAAPVTEVTVPATAPLGDWFVVVADDGKVLHKEDRNFYAHGTVFKPSAVVKLQNPGLTDQNDSADAVPAEAYEQVDLLGLDDSGYLTGEYASTENTSGRVQSSDGEFHFDRSQDGFEEVMVYFHLDFAQRYFQSLGFDNVNNRVQKVNVNGISDDNSFYRPSTKNLTFGTGGVDDAEDAEIIFHEYGHSTQDNQVPGWGSGGHARAMGEAFGDYLGGAVSQRFSDFQVKCVGDWDGVSYSNDDPPCLRRLDGTKHFPEDLNGSVHADGEIWSAALWQIHEGMGGEHGAMHIVLAHHFLLAPGSTMPEAAEALIAADAQLNDGANLLLIKQVMVARGILEESGTLTVALADEAGAAVGGVATLTGAEEVTLDIPADGGSATALLQAGEYTLRVRAFGYLPPADRAFAVEDGSELTESFTLVKAATATLTGAVADATGAPVAAKIRLLGTPLPAVIAGDDGAFSVTAPVGSYDVQVSAFGYRTQVLEDVAVPSEGLAIVMEDLAPVLLVDDDSTQGGANKDYETFFEAALQASGHGEYEVMKGWQVTDAADLASFETVVWFTGGRMSDVMNEAQRVAIDAYLAGGGRLIASGQDLGYGLRSNSWLKETLGVIYVKDSSEDKTIQGAGLSLELGGDSADNQSYPDVIDAATDSTLFLRYGDEGGAGLVHDEGEGRVVYLGFGLEGVDGAEGRAALMGACFEAGSGGAGERRAVAAEWFR